MGRMEATLVWWPLVCKARASSVTPPPPQGVALTSLVVSGYRHPWMVAKACVNLHDNCFVTFHSIFRQKQDGWKKSM